MKEVQLYSFLHVHEYHQHWLQSNCSVEGKSIHAATVIIQLRCGRAGNRIQTRFTVVVTPIINLSVPLNLPNILVHSQSLPTRIPHHTYIHYIDPTSHIQYIYTTLPLASCTVSYAACLRLICDTYIHVYT